MTNVSKPMRWLVRIVTLTTILSLCVLGAYVALNVIKPHLNPENVERAIEDHRLLTLRFILWFRPDLSKGQHDGKRTPLHQAVGWGHPAVALLMQKGARMSARDRQGYTPLLYAVFLNRVRSAELLMEHGADVSVANERGVTALHYAAATGSPPRLVLELLARGADPNARDSEGLTPLHWAPGPPDNREAARILIARGAAVDAESVRGWTPLHYAAHEGSIRVLSLLVAEGADWTKQTASGHTPLMLAQESYDRAKEERSLSTDALAQAVRLLKALERKDSADWHTRRTKFSRLLLNQAETRRRVFWPNRRWACIALYISWDECRSSSRPCFSSPGGTSPETRRGR